MTKKLTPESIFADLAIPKFKVGCVAIVAIFDKHTGKKTFYQEEIESAKFEDEKWMYHFGGDLGWREESQIFNF